jgi:hypothetical protein
MVKFCFFCFVAIINYHCLGQKGKDIIDEIISLPAVPNKKFEATGGKNEFTVCSNYTFEDSLAFDIPFSKKSLNFKTDETLSIELWNESNKVYSDTRSIGFFEYIYLTNFPKRNDCYAIRIRLEKNQELLFNPDSENMISYKLYLKIGKKVIYGDGLSDVKLVFLKSPIY